MIPKIFRNKDGELYIKMHVDIMIHDGRRFYATAHIQVPLEFSFKIGLYCIPLQRVEQLVLEKDPTVKNERYKLLW